MNMISDRRLVNIWTISTIIQLPYQDRILFIDNLIHGIIGSKMCDSEPTCLIFSPHS